MRPLSFMVVDWSLPEKLRTTKERQTGEQTTFLSILITLTPPRLWAIQPEGANIRVGPLFCQERLMILILSQNISDPTTEIVADWIEALGGTWDRLNGEDLEGAARFGIELSPK